MPEREESAMPRIQVLSLACPECDRAVENARNAVIELGLEAEVELVEDPRVITEFGIYVTPALAIDGEVRIAGRVPTVAEIKSLLTG
jgi:small redox-active disulfide protein 2